MSMRLRLTLAFGLGTAVLSLIGGFAFTAILAANLRDSLVASMQTRAATLLQSVGASAGAGVNFPDSGLGGGATSTSRPGQAPQSGTAIAVADGTLYEVLTPAGGIADSTPSLRGIALLTQRQIRGAVPTGVTVEVHLSGQPTPFLVLAEPVPGSRDVLVVASSLLTVDQALQHVTAELIVVGLLAVAIASLAAWRAARAVLTPVERMRRQAAAISEQDSSRRLAVPTTGDEITALALTMNALLDRLHAALDRQRDFVAMAGHELRTPLTTLRVELELAASCARSQSEFRSAISGAITETDRVIRLAEDLLLLAADGTSIDFLSCGDLDLVDLAQRCVGRLASRARRQDVNLDCATLGSVVVGGDHARLGQVLDNLLDNALNVAPPGSGVKVAVGACGGTATVEVRDSGPGFPQALLPRAFDRFTRGDNSRDRRTGGTGLGLAIVRTIVEAHGGTVSVRNRAEGGAHVTVRLPLLRPE